MRAFVFGLALAAVVFASAPAFASSKTRFSDAARAQAAAQMDPCAVSNSPHAFVGRRFAGGRCHVLLARLAKAPQDQEALAACNRLASVLNGRRCAGEPRQRAAETPDVEDAGVLADPPPTRRRRWWL